jgi:dihydroorotase
MRRALQYASITDRPLALHCEEPTLSHGGHVHEGRVAAELGFTGYPSVAESVAVERDLALAGYESGRVHVLHLSAAESVDALRRAREAGVAASGEATPHHLVLTDDAVRSLDPNVKMNPPLRAERDRVALLEAVRDGTIEAIATDHAPHAAHEKEQEFDRAPFGLVGLETVVPLTLDRLVRQRGLTLPQAVARLATNPGRVLASTAQGMAVPAPELLGTLHVGAAGDLTVIDLERPYRVEAAKLYSKSKNTPFDGWELAGCATLTIVGGRIVMRDGAVVGA